MLFQPSVIALLLAATLSLVMVSAAAPFAWQILRRWDLGSGSELQLQLERRTYLFSTLAAFVCASQLLALLLFVFTADRLSAMFVGAMCAVGALNADAWGFPALLLQVALFFLAALWLVPRLSGFQARHPDIGIRVSADNRAVDLEAEEVDVALRYGTPEAAPAGSLKLFDETLAPVVAPPLAASLPDGPRLSAANLAHLTLLSFEDGRDYPWLRWEGWLSQLAPTPPAAKALLQFNHYDQCIYAALAGQGAALGRLPLIRDHLEAGRLIPLAPPQPTPGRRAYYLLRSPSAKRPEVEAFAEWLIELGKGDGTANAQTGSQSPSGN